MRLLGKRIKTMSVNELDRVCKDWKSFAKEPTKYKDTIVLDLVVHDINSRE